MSLRTHLVALVLWASGIAQAAQFTISYNSMPAAGQIAFEHAADIWADILVSPVPIKVQVVYFPMGGATLGITFPNGRRDFPAAPLQDTWYATSLANSIAGIELNPGEDDINIYFDSNANWSFDTTGNPGPGQYDFVSVALHEIGHGLGFVGLAKKEGAIGSFGLLEAADFAPLVTSFPWPELDTLPGIFDRYLTDALDGPLAMLPNPGAQLGSALTSNQVYFNGPIVMALNGGVAPRIYAPGTFALGSSCVHLNEANYPPGSPNEMMTPFIAAGHANHWPGPLCIAMLADIGWTIAGNIGMDQIVTPAPILIWPNPVTNELHLQLPDPNDALITVTDLSGKTVQVSQNTRSMDVTSLTPGTYFLLCRSGGTVQRGRFIKR